MIGRVLPEEADKTEAESSAGRDGASKAEELVNITDMFVQLPRLGGRSTELAASERGAKGNKVTTQKLWHNNHAGQTLTAWRGIFVSFLLAIFEMPLLSVIYVSGTHISQLGET